MHNLIFYIFKIFIFTILLIFTDVNQHVQQARPQSYQYQQRGINYGHNGSGQYPSNEEFNRQHNIDPNLQHAGKENELVFHKYFYGTFLMIFIIHSMIIILYYH